MNRTADVRNYAVITGFFHQDEGSAVAYAVPPRLGLRDPSADRWPAFMSRLQEMNDNADENVSYKLIIAGRHGQGYHNTVELIYGFRAWDETWCRLEGDGNFRWAPDPRLTDLGEEQAHAARRLWEEELGAGLPLPSRLYCSPMTRALKTCELTFGDLVDFQTRRPVILENCREMYGRNPCDKRSNAAYIRETFPGFELEEGFAEEDELYNPETRETVEHVTKRARLVLDRVFSDASRNETLISITSHNEFINGICRAVGHEPIVLITGGILPLVVECTSS